jgi:uncharacterized protein
MRQFHATWNRQGGTAWLLAVLLSGLLTACGFPLSAEEGSRYPGVLERAFPDPGAQALAIAAERGDAAEVRRLMRDEGVDPDVHFSKDGMPLLAWAIYTKSPEGLRALLENGADPNAAKPYPRREGFTPTNHANAMVWAAEREDQVYLNLLLDHGGDPDTRNANNEVLLFHAFIKQNQWRNVQLLVERGADVNAEVYGSTILSEYASRGGFMMTHWLLEHGADPTLDYAFGKPVHAPDSHAIEAVYWHPGTPDDPAWQRKCQQWLLARGHVRPPMPEHYRLMRERLGFPHREDEIPLL